MLGRGVAHALGGPAQTLALAVPDQFGDDQEGIDPELLSEVAGAALGSLDKIIPFAGGLARYPANEEIQPVDIAGQLAEVAALRRLLRPLASLEFSVALEPNLPAVRGTPGEIVHAILASAVWLATRPNSFTNIIEVVVRELERGVVVAVRAGPASREDLVDGPMDIPGPLTILPGDANINIVAALVLMERMGGTFQLFRESSAGDRVINLKFEIWG